MSKNGHPNYVPEYVKLHPGIYHIAKGPDGAPVASLSPHCKATLKKDCRAFGELMRFLKEYDEAEKTVLAVQIENEMGYANTDRDYSEEAEQDYQALVPTELKNVEIPESPIRGEANAMNLILAAGKYGAEGVACFGAESALNEEEELNPDSADIALSMRILAKMAPLLIRYHGTEHIYAFAQEEFETYRYLKLPDYHINMKYTNCNPSRYGYTCNVWTESGKKKISTRGRAILVQTAPEEFYLCGAGAMAEFIRRPSPESEDSYQQLSSRQFSQLNFLSVEEGHFENGEWMCEFIRNGDETNFAQYVLDGQMIRIRLNPKVE